MSDDSSKNGKTSTNANVTSQKRTLIRSSSTGKRKRTNSIDPTVPKVPEKTTKKEEKFVKEASFLATTSKTAKNQPRKNEERKKSTNRTKVVHGEKSTSSGSPKDKRKQSSSGKLVVKKTLPNKHRVNSKKQLKVKAELSKAKIAVYRKGSPNEPSCEESVRRYSLRNHHSTKSDSLSNGRKEAKLESAAVLGSTTYSYDGVLLKQTNKYQRTRSCEIFLNNAATNTVAYMDANNAESTSMSTAVENCPNVSFEAFSEKNTKAQSKSRSSKSNNFSMTKPQTNLSTSKFSVLSKLNTYIDKTPAIETIIEKNSCLVTAPRRFGKSSLLSMISCFFSLETSNGIPVSKYYIYDDDEEKRVPITDTENYKLFADKKFKITENKEIMRKHFGQYPLINLNFKSPSIEKAKDGEKACQDIISEAYKKHRYLMSSNKLEDDERELCVKWTKSPSSIKEGDFALALKHLSSYLRKHFNRRIIVVIDEYDSICVKTMLSLSLSKQKQIKHMINFFSAILGFLLKDNDENVKLGFVTGISYICTAGLSELNNLNSYRFLVNEPFFEFYGLTDEEVDVLLRKFPLKNDIEDVKKACNGYEYHGRNIYSFLSVLSYLQEGILSNYWSKSGVFLGLKGALKCSRIKYLVEHLMQGNTVDITPLTQLVPDDVIILKACIENPKLEVTDVSKVFGFFVEQGYLCIINESENNLVVKIPNQEIRNEFKRLLTQYFVEKWNVDVALVKICANYFNDLFRNPRKFLSDIRDSLTSIFSSVNVTDGEGHPLNEAVFQHILYFVIVHTKYKCCTELYCHDRNRLDLCLIFEKFGVIIEIKFNGSSTMALEQILEKNYCSIFEDDRYITCDIADYVLIGLNITKRGKTPLAVNLSYLINNKDMDHEVIL